MAELYHAQKRYTEAEPLFLQALDIRKRQVGEEHPDTAISLAWLSQLYESQGRYSEAEPLLVHAIQIDEQSLGSDHPYTVGFRNHLEYLRSKQ